MTEQPKIIEWIEEEEKTLQPAPTGERLQGLHLESGKVVKIKIDFSKPFEKWTDPKGRVKALIPVEHKGERKIWWINTRNPIYRQILERGKQGQTEFAISTTGTQENTRYTLVEEE